MTLIVGAGACDRRYVYLDTCGDCLSADGGATAVPTLVAGTAFSCANVARALYCWGDPPAALARDDRNDWSRPARVADLSTTIAAAAGPMLCAIDGGQVVCWGNNDTAQQGSLATPACGGPTCNSPRANVAGTEGAVALAVSGSHGCAVLADGNVVCWGANDNGQLGHQPGEGDGACASSDVAHCNPLATRVGVSDAVELAVGADPTGAHGFGCARLRDGSVTCWGDNTKGQISGAGFVVGAATDLDPHPRPATIPGLEASALAAGSLSVCAITAPEGHVVCWGDGAAGQGAPPAGIQMLTAGTSGSFVFLDQVTSLAHGTLHTCAVRLGTVYCWGNNRSKQLGRDAHSSFDAPCIVDGQGDYCSVTASPVAGLFDVVNVGAAGNHTCAGRRDGSVYCWGSNTFQESGHPLQAFGDLDPQRTPVMVQVPIFMIY